MKQIPSDPDMPVYRVEQGEQIDFLDFEPMGQVMPIACAVKADGTTQNKPSFCFVVQGGLGFKVLMQVSLEMLRPAIDLALRMEKEQ